MNTSPINFKRLEADLAKVAMDQPKQQPDRPLDVIQQTEYTAKYVEEMLNESKARASALIEALKECDYDLKLIAESALAVREKGKRVMLQIEEAMAFSKEVREVCEAIKNRVK